MMALPPGSSIGILGGGQLGRMLALAAAKLGFDVHVFTPEMDSPAARVAAHTIIADYDDLEALQAFASICDVITYEFENVPSRALDILAALPGAPPVRPGRRALETSQDRLAEKRFLQSLGLPCAPFAPVESLGDLQAALAALGTPAILKTRRFGYDGKGQVRLSSPAEAPAAWAALAGAPAVLEGFVQFSREISVIAARGLDGALAAYTPGENRHEAGILRQTRVPATLSAAEEAAARGAAEKMLGALDYIGVMGVEFFVTPAGLLINEFAPRVHNSGHWTQNGCATDQFEQHIRAITGWPLGDTGRFADVVMENLIGAEVDRALAEAQSPGTALHLYGKGEARAGRKMGHLNRAYPLGRL